MVIPATIEELVRQGEESEISYRNLHTDLVVTYNNTGETVRVPLESLFGKYRYFLEKTIVPAKLHDVEFEVYRFKPKALSDRLYGTTEFWSGLLEINHCLSVIDFNNPNIKVYDPLQVKSLINEILILEGIIR